MIRMTILIIVGIFFSCSNESGNGPLTPVYQTTGSFSYTFEGKNTNSEVPAGAGYCRIIGNSTKYFIEVNASTSKENRSAQISQIVFWGNTKSSEQGLISLGSTDSTFRFGFYDDKGNAYVGGDGTITFTTFPSQAGDTLKGDVSCSVQSIVKYDPKPFTSHFSLVCESFN